MTDGAVRPVELSPSPLEPVLAGRSRIALLLARANECRAVVICAPAGSGKTTALLHYVSRSSQTTQYVCFTPQTSQAVLDDILSPLNLCAEIAIDEVDAAPAPVIQALVQHIGNREYGRRFLLAGRSRTMMHAHIMLATGTATSIDAADLAFTADEVAELAERLGAPHDDEAITQLLHDSGGWPVAVAWIIRDAADAGRTLRGAFESWRGSRGHILLEYLSGQYERCGNFSDFKTMLQGGHATGQRDLERYEALGFPVTRTRASFRPYRILSKLTLDTSEPAEHSPSGSTLLAFSVLGRFRCRFDGQDVRFQRRRDRNVFTYVALAPEGRATREQLLAAFWPDSNRAVATQSLRTTLSRIRTALGQVVGQNVLHRFFDSADDVRVHLSEIVLDARRFGEHFDRARSADARLDGAAAKYHYSTAARLYRDELLASEPMEPCFLARRDALETTYVKTLERLVQLYTVDENHEAATQCANKLRERTSHASARLGTPARQGGARHDIA